MNLLWFEIEILVDYLLRGHTLHGERCNIHDSYTGTSKAELATLDPWRRSKQVADFHRWLDSHRGLTCVLGTL
jgi:hypothetical protein